MAQIFDEVTAAIRSNPWCLWLDEVERISGRNVSSDDKAFLFFKAGKSPEEYRANVQ